MRTIIIETDNINMADAMEKSNPVEVRKVIGYFSIWGIDDPFYAHVTIYISNTDKDDPRPVEISALYTEEPGRYDGPRYYMAAIWRSEEGKFSVHS
jgi:hypothetical protein